MHNLKLRNLFVQWADEDVLSVEQLPESGSNRLYYRIIGTTKTAIGVFSTDKTENIAFLDFSKKLKQSNVNVPEIYATDIENNVYLQQDLGDLTLFNYVEQKGGFDEELINLYKKVLQGLIDMQINAANKIDYSLCYPRSAFDRQSIQWDLNYFKYYFLKLADIPFHEQLLENDFNTLINFLLDEDTNYFLFRDFQSRNIMLVDGQIYFIDYQGGRRGALQYDVASLLYDAKANLPQSVRDELLQYYIIELKKYKHVDADVFTQKYYGYVLIRILQAMGAFGFRGFFERKKHFLQSIPYAINNIEYLLNKINLGIDIPHLKSALLQLSKSEKLKDIAL